MHSNHLFLVTVDNPDETDIQELAADAESSWDHRFGPRLDENNWYTIWGFYYKGKMYVREDEGKPFEAQEVDEEGEDLRDPFRLAMGIAAIDLQLYDAVGLSLVKSEGRDKIDDMTSDELLEAITTEIPKDLSALYEKASGTKPTLDYEKDAYRRYKASKGYELFMNSFIPPFACYPSNAYDWRCWDCRENNYETFNSEKNAILLVDIHT